MADNGLLYFAPRRSTFVTKDVEILSKHFRVRLHCFLEKQSKLSLLLIVRQLAFILKNCLHTSSFIIMFGGYHAVLPTLIGRLFRKNVLIVLGGTDCVSFPSINYGTFRKKLQSTFTCLSYRYSTKLLPVHSSLILRRNSYYNIDSEFQGFRYWCKKSINRISIIPNGYNAALWQVKSEFKIPNTFITIATLNEESVITLKGIDLIFHLASELPNCQFTIIGNQNPSLRFPSYPNLQVLPLLAAHELLKYLETSRYYLQLSISEGFPNALCEAMLAECVPIGSNVASIPDIIGDTGFILKSRDKEELLSLVKLVISHPDPAYLATLAKEKIAANYDLALRESLLLTEIVNG